MIEGRMVRLRAWEKDDAQRGHKWMNDRYCDVLVMGVLRDEFGRPEADSGGWAGSQACLQPDLE